MARLHIRYREDKFDPRMVELTRRFVEAKPWRDADPLQKFEVWVHGACLIYEIEKPYVNKISDHMPADGPSYGSYDWLEDQKAGVISLRRWSLISLFHQFYHHLQQLAAIEVGEDEATDAQAFACSLLYVVAPRRYRRMVRRNRVAGVHPEDLLKRRAA